MTTESIQLKDGRTLCFARYGAPGGKPVIYLNGAGSSRFDGEIYDVEARAAGVQVIATDRPGCGGSSPVGHRTFLSYAEDLRQLADALGIRKFAVAGMSNGGPHAMAAATALPDRVTAVIPINSSTPVHDPAARRATPLVVRMSYKLMRYIPGTVRKSIQRLVESPKTPDWQRKAARECLRQPDSGYLEQELQLASTDWGFDHTAVVQPVEIFNGNHDAGFGYAPIWAERLPRGRLHVIAGGHVDYGAPEARARIVAAMAAAL